jgi:hypothetical protein
MRPLRAAGAVRRRTAIRCAVLGASLGAALSVGMGSVAKIDGAVAARGLPRAAPLATANQERGHGKKTIALDHVDGPDRPVKMLATLPTWH